MRRQPAGKVRIIGGHWRSRRIAVTAGTRPSPDFVRETVFNLLTKHLPGAAGADLYAGSGALGFEALSRGAARLLFVDKSRAAASQLRHTAALLGAAGRVRIESADALQWLAGNRARGLSIIFADPPYRMMKDESYRVKLLGRIYCALAAGGIAYVESPAPLAVDDRHWQSLKQGRCGNACWSLLAAAPGRRT